MVGDWLVHGDVMITEGLVDGWFIAFYNKVKVYWWFISDLLMVNGGYFVDNLWLTLHNG